MNFQAPRLAARTALTVLAALPALSACSGDSAETAVATVTRDAPGREVLCGGEPVADVAFRGKDIADMTLSTYLINDESDIADEEYAGIWCVQVETSDDLAAPPISVTFEAPPMNGNYGQRFEAFTEPGADNANDEVFNFPFTLGVYGGCRDVAATVTLASGTRLVQSTSIGNDCPAVQ